MFIETMLSSNTQTSKAALRATANSALMRACGIALRLSAMYRKHIGNGVDGFNDLRATVEAAKVKAAQLNSAGRDGDDLETLMHKFMALYLSLNSRMQDETFHKPLEVGAALTLLATEREYDKTEGSEYIKALSEVLGTSAEELLARQAQESVKQAERNRDLAPFAQTLLESCGDNGQDEDDMLADLPVTAQFAILTKAIDSAANQLDRDVGRTLQYANSKSSVLRNLALSDTAAGKADLTELEKCFTRFYELHRSELS